VATDFVQFIRKLLPFTTALVVIMALYVGWIFYSRWDANRDAERAQAEARVQNAQKVLEAYGGNKVKVLNLSLNRGVIHPGETTQLCYGVSNAKTVTVSPSVGETWPSMYRCVDVSPKTDTTYTLTARDGQGDSVSKSIEIKVEK
jgi:preprotein translocase subunit YajC